MSAAVSFAYLKYVAEHITNGFGLIFQVAHYPHPAEKEMCRSHVSN